MTDSCLFLRVSESLCSIYFFSPVCPVSKDRSGRAFGTLLCGDCEIAAATITASAVCVHREYLIVRGNRRESTVQSLNT